MAGHLNFAEAKLCVRRLFFLSLTVHALVACESPERLLPIGWPDADAGNVTPAPPLHTAAPETGTRLVPQPTSEGNGDGGVDYNGGSATCGGSLALGRFNTASVVRELNLRGGLGRAFVRSSTLADILAIELLPGASLTLPTGVEIASPQSSGKQIRLLRSRVDAATIDVLATLDLPPGLSGMDDPVLGPKSLGVGIGHTTSAAAPVSGTGILVDVQGEGSAAHLEYSSAGTASSFIIPVPMPDAATALIGNVTDALSEGGSATIVDPSGGLATVGPKVPGDSDIFAVWLSLGQPPRVLDLSTENSRETLIPPVVRHSSNVIVAFSYEGPYASHGYNSPYDSGLIIGEISSIDGWVWRTAVGGYGFGPKAARLNSDMGRLCVLVDVGSTAEVLDSDGQALSLQAASDGVSISLLCFGSNGLINATAIPAYGAQHRFLGRSHLAATASASVWMLVPLEEQLHLMSGETLSPGVETISELLLLELDATLLHLKSVSRLSSSKHVRGYGLSVTEGRLTLTILTAGCTVIGGSVQPASTDGAARLMVVEMDPVPSEF